MLGVFQVTCDTVFIIGGSTVSNAHSVNLNQFIDSPDDFTTSKILYYFLSNSLPYLCLVENGVSKVNTFLLLQILQYIFVL